MINDNDLQALNAAQPAWRIPGKSILGDGIETAHQFATIEVAPIIPVVVQQDTPAAQIQTPSAQGAGNEGGAPQAVRAVVIDPGTMLPTTVTINVLTS